MHDWAATVLEGMPDSERMLAARVRAVPSRAGCGASSFRVPWQRRRAVEVLDNSEYSHAD